MKPKLAHVIVSGNEKGGSGKSTLSFHIAIALMKAGHRVATFDLDTRQRSFSRYVENRRKWAEAGNLKLEVPTHFCLEQASGGQVLANEDAEAADFAKKLGLVEQDHDFIVIDTPGSDSFLQRLAHLVADTLVTPVNDSFVDLDVLARINPQNWEIESLSQYALEVRKARRERRKVDKGMIDWIVVRNRLSPITSRNEMRVAKCMNQLSAELGFRMADGVGERVIFRELFPYGLTALDDLDAGATAARPSLSHISSRNEIRHLIAAMHLPATRHEIVVANLRGEALSGTQAVNSPPDVLH